MTEIIIAIILQIVTLAGGQPTSEKEEIPTDKEKGKKEMPMNSQGVSGNWNENGNG